jgi:hypothetical protein
MVEADSHLKLLPPSTLDFYKGIENRTKQLRKLGNVLFVGLQTSSWRA